MLRCVTALLAALLLAAPAFAQAHRSFPAHTLRGELVIGNPPEATLNGQPARLAPGARIRGENNLLEMSGALSGRKLVVHYTKETSGLLLEVWVLNATGRANRPWPVTEREAQAWQFDPVGQTWTKP
jgi:hypothetical protein